MSTAKEAAKREASKLSLSLAGSLLFAIAVCVFIAVNRSTIGLPALAIAISLPLVAYGYSLALSAGSQYITCGTVNIKLISLQNLLVFGLNALVCGLLYLENLPLKKYFLGEFPPFNPLTGLPLDPASMEYTKAMETENHYKLQFFSGVVTAVLPQWMDESLKEGLVYCYWIFWLNMLPLYTLLGLQTTCG